jgi:hypothetical protein
MFQTYYQANIYKNTYCEPAISYILTRQKMCCKGVVITSFNQGKSNPEGTENRSAITESDGERVEKSIGKLAHPGRLGSRQVA